MASIIRSKAWGTGEGAEAERTRSLGEIEIASVDGEGGLGCVQVSVAHLASFRLERGHGCLLGRFPGT